MRLAVATTVTAAMFMPVMGSTAWAAGSASNPPASTSPGDALKEAVDKATALQATAKDTYTPVRIVHDEGAVSVALDGHGFAYVLSTTQSRLYKVDLAQPEKIEVVTKITGSPESLALDGKGNAYVATVKDGIQRVNLNGSDHSPRKVSDFQASHLGLDGEGRLYATPRIESNRGGLFQIDVSNPDWNSTQIFRLQDAAEGFFVNGDGIVYIAKRGDGPGLYRADLATTNPVPVKVFDLQSISSVALDSSGSAFVGGLYSGMYRVDLTAENPKPVKVADFPRLIGLTLDAEGNAFVVGNGTNGGLYRVDGVSVAPTPAPAAPVVASPGAGSVVREPKPKITGTAPAGSKVEVRSGKPDGPVIGSVTLGTDTINWSVTPNEALPDGETKIYATAQKNGTTSSPVEHSFTVNTNKVLPGNVEETALADFTKDGKADLVARDKKDGKVYLFKGKGDGTFEEGAKLYDSWDYTQTTAGDFNGDQKADLVAAKGDILYLSKGNGDGTFAAPVSLTKGWSEFEETTAGDFNNDGSADLVARNKNDNKLSLWLGSTGTGNPFGSPRFLTNWPGFKLTTGGDVNGDGNADLLATDANDNLKVWLSDGSSTGNPFARPVSLTKWAGFDQMASGDLNGDQKDDLIAVDTNRNAVKTWKSTGTLKPHLFEAPKTLALHLPLTY